MFNNQQPGQSTGGIFSNSTQANTLFPNATTQNNNQPNGIQRTQATNNLSGQSPNVPNIFGQQPNNSLFGQSPAPQTQLPSTNTNWLNQGGQPNLTSTQNQPQTNQTGFPPNPATNQASTNPANIGGIFGQNAASQNQQPPNPLTNNNQPNQIFGNQQPLAPPPQQAAQQTGLQFLQQNQSALPQTTGQQPMGQQTGLLTGQQSTTGVQNQAAAQPQPAGTTLPKPNQGPGLGLGIGQQTQQGSQSQQTTGLFSQQQPQQQQQQQPQSQQQSQPQQPSQQSQQTTTTNTQNQTQQPALPQIGGLLSGTTGQQPAAQINLQNQPAAQNLLGLGKTNPPNPLGGNASTQQQQAAAAPPNILGGQPQPQKTNQQPARQAGPKTKPILKTRKYCDNFYLREKINNAEEQHMLELFKEDSVLQESLIQGSSWYKLLKEKQQSQQDQLSQGLDGDIRQKCFGDLISDEVYYVLIKSMRQDYYNKMGEYYKQKSQKNEFYEQKMVDFRHKMFCHYSEQRALLMSCVKLLFTNCLVNDDVFVRTDKVYRFLLDFICGKNMIEYLVISFQNAREVVDFYNKEAFSEQYSNIVYNHLAKEQITILEIMILLSQYFIYNNKLSQEDFDKSYGQYARKMMLVLGQCKLLGIFYENEKLNQIHQTRKQQTLIEKLSIVFILGQVMLPLSCEEQQQMQNYGLEQTWPLWAFKQHQWFDQLPNYVKDLVHSLAHSQYILINKYKITNIPSLPRIPDYQGSLNVNSELYQSLIDLLKCFQKENLGAEIRFAAYIAIFQWINMYYSVKEEEITYESDICYLEIILSMLLKDGNMCALFKANRMHEQADTADQKIFLQTPRLKILSHYKFDGLELLQDDDGFWPQILNAILDFTAGKNRQKIQGNGDFIGTHRQASMDYYRQDFGPRRINKNLSLSVDALTQDMHTLKVITQFMKNQIQQDSNLFIQFAQILFADIRNEIQQNNWSTLLQQIVNITQECSRIMQLVIETHQQDAIASRLIGFLLSIGSNALCIVNEILLNPQFRNIASQIMQQMIPNNQWHPLFELFNIIRKLEASLLFQNKRLQKVNLNYLEILQTVISFDYSLEQFPVNRTPFFQNLMDIFGIHFLSRWRFYESDKSTENIQLQKEILGALHKILSKFLIRKSKDHKDTQMHTLIMEMFNKTNSQLVLEFLLSYLDIELTEAFFDDNGQKSLKAQEIRRIGLQNIRYFQMGKLQQNDTDIVGLLINCVEVWNVLIDLYQLKNQSEAKEQINNQLQLVLAVEQFFTGGDAYCFKKLATNKLSENKRNIVSLHFLHAIIALLNIQSDVKIIPRQPVNQQDEDQQEFKIIYDESGFQNYRGFISREQPLELFSSSIRILMKLQFTQNLEEVITNVQIIENNSGYTRQIHYAHLIIQTLYTILDRLNRMEYLQDIMEFLIVSFDNNQSYMQYLMKAQYPLQGQMVDDGIRYFLNCLKNVLENQQYFQVHKLVFLFFNQVMSKKNLHFVKKCRTDYADGLKRIFGQAYQQLTPNFKQLDLFSEFGIGEPKQVLLQTMILRGSVIEQIVLENSIIDAINQLSTLEMFLKLLLNEVKWEHKENTDQTFSDFTKTLFSKHFIRNWLCLIIKFCDNNLYQQYVKNGQKLLQYKNINPIYNHIKSCIYSYGRDYLIDSHSYFYQQKNGNAAYQMDISQLQRLNLLSGWFEQITITLKQISQFCQFFVSAGLSGYSLSNLTQVQDNQFINLDLAHSIFYPNHKKLIVQGGVMSLFSQSEEQSFKSQQKFLELLSKEVYDHVDCLFINQEFLIPTLEILKCLYQCLKCGVHRQLQLGNLVDHQIDLYNHIVKQIEPHKTTHILKVSLLRAFKAFLVMINRKNLENDAIIDLFKKFVSFLNQSQEQYEVIITEISQILCCILNKFNVSELILTKSPSSQYYDICSLQLDFIKSNHKNSITYSSIIQCWVDIVQKFPSYTKQFIINQKLIKILTQHQDLSLESEYINQIINYKHIMWCHTLVFLREALAADTQCQRMILEFMSHHEQRLYSTLLQLDMTQQYQTLKQFTHVTGLTLRQVVQREKGFMSVFEINQILQLFLELLLSDGLSTNFIIDFDKLVYVFISIISQQIGAFKKLRLFLNSVVPNTELERKINELEVSQDQNDKQQRLLSSPSPNRRDASLSENQSNNLQKSQRQYGLKNDVDNLSLFQLLCTMEYLRTGHYSTMGIVASMNQLQIDRSFEIEDNLWNSFGANLSNFILFTLDAFANLSRMDNLENLLKVTQQLMHNHDFLEQTGSILELCSYAKSKNELLVNCRNNLYYAFSAVLQYLNLRNIYRKINFIKDSYNMELQLTQNMNRYIDQFSNDQQFRKLEMDVLEQERREHTPNDAQDTPWNHLKNRFDEIRNEFIKL